MKGFRNILVHGYGDIEDRIVHEMAKEGLGDFEAFKKEVLEALSEDPEAILQPKGRHDAGAGAGSKLRARGGKGLSNDDEIKGSTSNLLVLKDPADNTVFRVEKDKEDGEQ